MTNSADGSDDGGARFPVVYVPPEARTPDTVVQYLLAQCPDLTDIQAEAALDQFLYRESLGSTNIGRGIAVPQAIGPYTDQAAVIAGRTAAPIDWPDGEPVQQVFLVVAPDHQSTLSWLESISRYLQFRSGGPA